MDDENLIRARTLLDALFGLPLLDGLPLWAVQILRPLVALFGLLLLFLLLRGLTARLVDRTTRALAAQEIVAGNERRAARVRTLAGLIKSVIFYALVFIFLTAALGTIGADIRGVLATAGVLGLAVGFGAQRLVRDVITGFFLLLEDQYSVGDYVTIGAVTGTVTEVGMRITRLRDDDGRLYIIANGDIGQVCNHSRGPLGGTLEIAISATADEAAASRALGDAFARAAQTPALGLAEPPRVDGIVSADAARTVLRVRFRAVTGERPAEVALRLREVVREALRAAEIPLA